MHSSNHPPSASPTRGHDLVDPSPGGGTAPPSADTRRHGRRATPHTNVRSRLARTGLVNTLALAVAISACSTGTDDDKETPSQPATTPPTIAIGALPATVATSPPPPPLSTVPATTASPPPTSELPTAFVTNPPVTVATPPAAPSSILPPPAPEGQSCVRAVTDGETLESIATTASVGVGDLWAENGFVEAVAAGDVVDVCVDNHVNDISGRPQDGLGDPSIIAAIQANVADQQRRLNELFTPYGAQPIPVDGISGPITGQRLCAARVALGLPTSINDMSPGSDEQRLLFATAQLPTPQTSATASDRWALIDRTCQMMFIGAGSSLVLVFPTSTGSTGFETRDQDRAVAFRYNPATDNGGWHNSNEYPVGVDNPLNGNLYKPIYFDLGQAIHGALTVPPTPQSKGCARLSVADHTTLLAWLGLEPVIEETWLKGQINLTVSVQGQFVGRPTEQRPN